MASPRSLRVRLLLAFLVVIGATIGTVGVAALLIGPGYFAEAMGHLPGDPMGEAMDAATRAAFNEAMQRALIAATVIAIISATVVGLAVAARIAEPIRALAAASHRIARGHYTERVPVSGTDEIGELATSFNEMAGSLEATERRRLRLVGDVAHELRTPLTTLDGYLEGLEDGVIAPSDATWALLRSETGRLTRLVSDLSELWQVEAHQVALRIEALDATAVAADVVERFRPLATTRSVTLELHGAPARCLADRDRLAQILANYLSNALRHAPDRSTITVTTTNHEESVIVSVADQGPGLGADQLDAVFERFYRVDPARSRASGGSGIGLAIVRALATAMDGRTWATSAGPGTGATFLLELPRVRGS